jgi:hypothetical protein
VIVSCFEALFSFAQKIGKTARGLAVTNWDQLISIMKERIVNCQTSSDSNFYDESFPVGGRVLRSLETVGLVIEDNPAVPHSVDSLLIVCQKTVS